MSQPHQRETTGLFLDRDKLVAEVEAALRDCLASPEARKPATVSKGMLHWIALVITSSIKHLAQNSRARHDELDARIKALESRPSMRYRNVFSESEQYGPGDFVTFDGSVWACLEMTRSRPGVDGSWRLAVKRGKDAR